MSNIGRRGAIGVGIEAIPGTTTTVKHFIPFLSCDLVERHTPIADNSAKGIREEQGGNSVEGKKWGEGSIEVVLDPITAGYWFGLALGDVTTSSTTIYMHEFYRKTSGQPRTATIYRNRVVDEVKFPYSAVNSLELNFADDIAKLTMDILSKYPVVEVDSPGYVDLELFTFKNAYVEINAIGGATSELKVREFTMRIDNNLETIYAPNSNDVDRIVSKSFNVSGNIVIDFINSTQRDAFKNLTKQKVAVIFAATTSRVEITIPQFRVDTNTIDTPIDDISQETIDFVAEYSGTGTGAIQVVVKNESVADYIPM